MELLTLPPEIICQILNRMTDTRDILSIFMTDNEYLISLARDCITTILTGNQLPIGILTQLVNVQQVKIPADIYSIEELLVISSLPKLKSFNFVFPYVNNYTDLLNLVLQFIKEYTKLGRDFKRKRFEFKFGNIFFIIVDNRPIFRWMEERPKQEQLTDISHLVNFLSEYNSYIPINYLDLECLRITNDYEVNYHSLIDLLNQMVELIGINFDIYLDEEIIIFNSLKGKITNIGGYLFLPGDELDMFEPSDSVKVFNCPVDVSELPKVFQKFPNVEIVHILGYIRNVITMGNRQQTTYGPPIPYKTLLEISQIPQLKTILIETPYPGLVPKSSKFKIRTKFNNK